MSQFQRPANKAYSERVKRLKNWLRKRKTGIVKRDMAEWGISEGLCDRTRKEYWADQIDLGFIEIYNNDGEDHWRLLENGTLKEDLDMSSAVPFTDYATTHISKRELEKAREELRRLKKGMTVDRVHAKP